MEKNYSKKLKKLYNLKLIKSIILSIIILGVISLTIFFVLSSVSKLNDIAKKIVIWILVSLCIIIIIVFNTVVYKNYSKRCYVSKLKDWKIFDINDVNKEGFNNKNSLEISLSFEEKMIHREEANVQNPMNLIFVNN